MRSKGAALGGVQGQRPWPCFRLPTAVAWSAAEAAAAAVFSFASAFFVARLVGPAALGVGAAVVSVQVLLWVGVTALFADAIVQRAVLDDAAAAGAFWAAVAVGGLAGVVQLAAGWPLLWLFGDPRLPLMALVLAAPLPLVGAAGVIQGRLTRERRYRLLACRVLLGQGVGTAVGCLAALGGAGVWAVVGQQAVTSLAGALVLLVGAGAGSPGRYGRCCGWAGRSRSVRWCCTGGIACSCCCSAVPRGRALWARCTWRSG